MTRPYTTGLWELSMSELTGVGMAVFCRLGFHPAYTAIARDLMHRLARPDPVRPDKGCPVRAHAADCTCGGAGGDR